MVSRGCTSASRSRPAIGIRLTRVGTLPSFRGDLVEEPHDALAFGARGLVKAVPGKHREGLPLRADQERPLVRQKGVTHDPVVLTDEVHTLVERVRPRVGWAILAALHVGS